VLTQTVPAVLAGGGLEAAALPDAELDLVVDDAGVLAGVLAGAVAGLAAGVAEAFEVAAGVDVAGAEAVVEEDASAAEADFLEPVFFLVEPAPESEAEEELSAAADFADFFFLVEVSLEEESAVCELSAESLFLVLFFLLVSEELSADGDWLVPALSLADFLCFDDVPLVEESADCAASAESLFVDFLFFVVVSELACAAPEVASSVAFFFLVFLVVASDWVWSPDWG
jgi:hypothetical protein